MAVGHISIRTHSRKRAHTAAAALAYRHGVRLECARSGEVYDYRRRRAKHDDVAGDGLVSARPTPLASDLDTLARAIEAGERRGDARLLRDVQLALPHELGHEARLALTEEFARYLAKRYDTVCAWAVHRPDRRGDARNHHAHIVLPTRRLSEDGEKLGAKLRQLDLSTQSPAEVQAIRSHWQRVANVALEAAGKRARVDTGRAPDGVLPQPTLGPACTAIERRVRPEAPDGTSVAELVRLDVPEAESATPAPGTDDAPLTWRGAALREWGESQARRDRERLQPKDPDPVIEDLVATVAPAAVAERFAAIPPTRSALPGALRHAAGRHAAGPVPSSPNVAVEARRTATRFKGSLTLRAAGGLLLLRRRRVWWHRHVNDPRDVVFVSDPGGGVRVLEDFTFERRLRGVATKAERKPERALAPLAVHPGPAALLEPSAAQSEATPRRFAGRLATRDDRLQLLRRIDAEPERKPEGLLEALPARPGPAPLRESATRMETTPERFQGRPRDAWARTPLPRADAAPRAAPERFAERLALRRQLERLRQTAVAPPSAPERFRERLAVRRARRRLRRVEVASERGPGRTLAPPPLSFGLAPLRQPSIAEERAPAPAVETERAPEAHLVQTEQDAIGQRLAAVREQDLAKRRRRRRAAERRRLRAVRKPRPLRRPRARSRTAPGRFRARLAARRRVVPLRRSVPAPHAASQRLPAQDLAAEIEAALERLDVKLEREIYGSEAVQLAGEYWRATLQHGPVTITFDESGPGVSTVNPIRLVDERGRSHYAGRHSIATLARMFACLQKARPEDIPELELTLEQELKRQRALALQRSRGISR